jgi:uncharacterized RDD family membrane protein YckC
MKDGTPDGPLSDFALGEADLRAHVPVPPPSSTTADLPLFHDRSRHEPDTDEAPLVTPSAVPRAPLAVRRNSGSPAKPRPRREAALESPRLALETAEMPVVPEVVPSAEARSLTELAARTAGTGARVAAAIIDLLITFAIDIAVLYLTLRICEVRFADILSLPLAPMIAFFALLNGGYFSVFVAAGGQTIGKMATGIRVIPGHPDATANDRVSGGHAIVRAAAYVVSALPLGLGFLPAFIGEDRRALHDRLADTRVVDA